jgi:hypothetical protein
MRYIKKYESYNKDITDEISDFFLELEENIGYSIHISESKIIKDSDNWGRKSKLRTIYGSKFISIRDHLNKLDPVDGESNAIIVRISKTNYIKKLTEPSIKKHWKKMENELLPKIKMIEDRCKKILELDLYGVMGEWYQIGKASHSDYLGKSYYKYETIVDCYTFAFLNTK